MREFSYCWDLYFIWKLLLKILRPRQNGRHFPGDIFRCIFLNENAWISCKMSLKFVPKCPFNNIPVLVQIMAWHQSGSKSLSWPMVGSLLMPQWVKSVTKIQSSAVITRSNIVRFYNNDYRNWDRKSIKCSIHKRHPIPRPNGRAMGCLLWIFGRRLTVL